MAAQLHHLNLVLLFGATMEGEMMIVIELKSIYQHAKPTCTSCLHWSCLSASMWPELSHKSSQMLWSFATSAGPMFFLNSFCYVNGELKSQTTVLHRLTQAVQCIQLESRNPSLQSHKMDIFSFRALGRC